MNDSHKSKNLNFATHTRPLPPQKFSSARMQWFRLYRTLKVRCFYSFHAFFDRFVTQLNKRARFESAQGRARARSRSLAHFLANVLFTPRFHEKKSDRV